MKIIGTGSALPSLAVTNDMLSVFPGYERRVDPHPYGNCGTEDHFRREFERSGH